MREEEIRNWTDTDRQTDSWVARLSRCAVVDLHTGHDSLQLMAFSGKNNDHLYTYLYLLEVTSHQPVKVLCVNMYTCSSNVL